jgi:hypothetical protein
MDSLRQDTKEWETTFHFPVDIERRKAEENATVSSAMRKIRNQLKVIDVWKQQVGENSDAKYPVYTSDEEEGSDIGEKVFITQEDSNMV